MNENNPGRKNQPLTIRHDTIVGGRPVTIIREGQKETVVERHPEDPEGLRPDRSSERGSLHRRWGSGN